MMNLEKMKQKKRTNTKSRVKKSLLAATTFLCLTTPLLQTQTAYAAENTTPAITIEKPDGWKQGETTIAVTVDASHMPEGFSIAKIEAKAGKDGSWQDVTGSGSITITGNQTVYVRVTDGDGKVYEQNRSIKCYDTEKPTLSASLTDGKRLMTKKGSLDFLLLIYYIESRRRLLITSYSFSPVPSPKTHPKVMTVRQNTHISSNDNNRTNKVYHPVEVVVSSLQVNCFT